MTQDFVKQLRHQATPTEIKLWKALRRKQFKQHKFRRQQPVGTFIVDFFCAEANLVVEIDGDIHFIGDAPLKDLKRQRFLESCGLRVIRITTEDVNKHLEQVLEALLAYL